MPSCELRGSGWINHIGFLPFGCPKVFCFVLAFSNSSFFWLDRGPGVSIVWNPFAITRCSHWRTVGAWASAEMLYNLTKLFLFFLSKEGTVTHGGILSLRLTHASSLLFYNLSLVLQPRPAHGVLRRCGVCLCSKEPFIYGRCRDDLDKPGPPARRLLLSVRTGTHTGAISLRSPGWRIGQTDPRAHSMQPCSFV